jgi:hypothetical protein
MRARVAEPGGGHWQLCQLVASQSALGREPLRNSRAQQVDRVASVPFALALGDGMLEEFGEEYLGYLARTKRLVPGVW